MSYKQTVILVIITVAVMALLYGAIWNSDMPMWLKVFLLK